MKAIHFVGSPEKQISSQSNSFGGQFNGFVPEDTMSNIHAQKPPGRTQLLEFSLMEIASMNRDPINDECTE